MFKLNWRYENIILNPFASVDPAKATEQNKLMALYEGAQDDTRGSERKIEEGNKKGIYL